MTAVIIIIIIAVILYFLFWNKKTDKKVATNFDEATIVEQENIFTDENGLQYRLVEKVREHPRKTYLKAELNGKYWGELNQDISNQFQHSDFFDFNIYEVKLVNAVYSKEPFQLNQDLKIPRERLPKLLYTILEKEGKEYEVNLHEPIFAHIKFNRKLHQNDGNEVFGTIDAIVSGYVFDVQDETYFEKEYLAPNEETTVEEAKLTQTKTPTGNIEYKGNYERTEYYLSDYKQTYWSDWKYKRPANTSTNEGCLSSVFGVLGAIIGIAFLLMMLPQMGILFAFFLILFLLNLIPKRFFNWLLQIIGLLLFIGFLIGLFQFFNTNSHSYIPKPTVVEKPEEQKSETEFVADTIQNEIVKDTLIKHFRVWEDYDGNKYEGTIWTKKSDFSNAKNYKNNLVLSQNSERAYDEILYRLKENDKYNLNGIYQLFDSIQQKKQLSQVKFAELIVSFIQDIPYTVIVPEDCNPNLYDDKFIREYLRSENARCDAFEKFGINSPVEFMSSLNGDCDTRTLLLYTIFVHYGFDVVLLSSEYYSHSLIGINLPISGIAFQYQNQRYVLWETTAPNIRAGILPKEISNLNYWRISLKSK